MTLAQARRAFADVKAQEPSFSETTDRVLEIGRAYLGVENAHLTSIDPVTEYWHAIASTDPAQGNVPPGLELDLSSTYCRHTLDADGSVRLHAASEEGWADDPAYETHGLETYHGTALRPDEHGVFGTLCFVSPGARPEPFSEQETLFAEHLAQYLEGELARAGFAQELDRRAAFIGVLNRVLRHNLRNDINIIQGHADLLAQAAGNGTEYVEPIRRKTRGLIAVSNKLRRIEPTHSASDRDATPLDVVVERAVGGVASEYPDAAITVDTDTEVVVRVAPSFEPALYEVVENAAKHTQPDPHVHVGMAAAPNVAEITVRDRGPGLPEQEQAVLERGRETVLSHGSGIGLWLVYWVVTSHGGAITVEQSSDGTTIRMSLPRSAAPNEEGILEQAHEILAEHLTGNS